MGNVINFTPANFAEIPNSAIDALMKVHFSRNEIALILAAMSSAFGDKTKKQHPFLSINQLSVATKLPLQAVEKAADGLVAAHAFDTVACEYRLNKNVSQWRSIRTQRQATYLDKRERAERGA